MARDYKSEISRLIGRVRSGRLQSSASQEASSGPSGTTPGPEVSVAKLGLWARLTATYTTGVPLGIVAYTFTEVTEIAVSPWWQDKVGGLVGIVAQEVNALGDLEGKRVRIFGRGGLKGYRFAFSRTGCTEGNGFCVLVWSLTDYCGDATDGTPVDCGSVNVPGGVSGANVTINHINTDDDSETLYTSGVTDSEGKYCTPTLPPNGTYRIHVTASDCPEQVGDMTVGSDCRSYTACFGFCCWKYALTIEDANDHSGLGPSFNCSNFVACGVDLHIDGTGVSSETVGICDQECPCPVGPTPETACDESTGYIIPDTVCTLTSDGYWDRCISIDTRCSVPAYEISGAYEMYSKEHWVLNTCCGTCTVTDGRPTEMIPKELFITATGPEEVLGGGGTRSVAVEYDTVLSSGSALVWKSECIESPGSWGVCLNYNQHGCLEERYCPDCGPIDPETGDPTGEYTCVFPILTEPLCIASKVMYGSQRIYLVQNLVPTDDNRCTLFIVVRNFWSGGCPDDQPNFPDNSVDPPPYCGDDPNTGLPTYARGIAKWCGQTCPCGIIGDIDPADFAPGIMFTQRALISCLPTYNPHVSPPDCIMCGPVDISGCAGVDISPDAPTDTCPQPIICAVVTE